MTAASARDTLFHGKDRGPSLHPRPKPRGHQAPLTLLDILPDRHPTATEHLDSWRSFGEISAGIIKDLTIRHEATK